MSQDEHGHDDHGHEPGGHEIDKMPNSRLFSLLGGLTVLTVLCCWGVIELFNMQVRGIEKERNSKESYRLTAYRDEQQAHRDNWARVQILDDDGLTVRDPKDPKPPEAGKVYGEGPHMGIVNRMPVAEAAALVLKDPKSFKAQRSYPGWNDPDPEAQATPAAAAPTGVGRPANPRGGARPQPGARPERPGARPGPAIRPAPGRPGTRPAPGRPGARPTGARPAGRPAAPPPKPAPPKPASPKPQ